MNAARCLRLLMVVALSASAGAVTLSVALAPAGFASGPSVALTPNGAPAGLTFAGGDVATASVMGLAGQQLTVATSAGTFAKSCDVRMSLRAPDNSVLGVPTCAGHKGHVSVASLPVDGSYTVSLAAGATASGTLTLAAKSAGGPPSITPDAAAVKIKWPRNTNEDIRLGFTSTANDGYSIVATGGNSSKNPCGVQARFVDSGGNLVGTTGVPCAGVGAFVDQTTMPSTGTFFVQFVGYDSRALNVTLYKVVDQTGAIAPDGTPVDLALTTPGQNARFTFSGTTGQRASVVLSSSNTLDAEIELVRPDGSGFRANQSPGFLDAQTLDATGTWTVLIDPVGASSTLTGTVSAYTFADIAGSADLSGGSHAVALVPGQRARYSFTGTVGQRVSAYLAGAKAAFGTCGPFDGPLKLVRPDGSTAVTGSCTNRDSFVDAFALDVAGTWTITVDPQGPAAGTATLRSYNVVDQTGSVVLGGPPAPISITVPGQNARFTFNAPAAHQNVSVALTDSTFPSCTLALQTAGGAGIRQDSCNLGSALVSVSHLAGGDYAVVFDPAGPGTGSATLQVS